MFDPWCPTCDARVLVTARRLLSLRPTPTGHLARLRCWCGTEVVQEVRRLGAATASGPAPVGAAVGGLRPSPPRAA